MRAPLRADTLEDLARGLEGLPRNQRGELVRARAGELGMSPGHLRRLLRAHRSAQAGQARTREPDRLVSPAQAQLIARTMQQAENARKQITISIGTAVEVLRRDGQLPPAEDWDPSMSTLQRALADRGLRKPNLSSRGFAVVQTSPRPNHAHFVDMSICGQWYLRPDGLTALHEFPQYKPEHEKKNKLWRYTLVDHYSGALFVQYFYAPGENSADLMAFLHAAWMPGEGLRRKLPFSGVPRFLFADQGPGLKATTTQNLLRLLDVAWHMHSAGNAKQSGAVEVAHRIWGDWFENKLRFQPARTLEELNERALRELIRLNCDPAHLHGRHGQTRISAWATIKGDEMRTPPSWERWVRLASAEPITRTVNEYGHISVQGQVLELAGNVYAREKVTVLEYPYADRRWRVLSCRDEELLVTELERDEIGFLSGGRSWELGSEGGAAAPRNLAQQLRAASEEAPVWIADPFEADEPVQVDFLVPEGTPAIEEAAVPPAALIDATAVRLRALRRLAELGHDEIGADLTAAIDARVGAGIPEDQVAALLDELLSPLAPAGALSTWFGGARTA